QYHDDPAYVAALAASVRELWETQGEPEKLLLSFHSIPQRYSTAGDPYHRQCLETARLLGEELGVADGRYEVAFQSRFGREPWLDPATDATVQALAGAGVESLDVLCPGFAVDCLETIEEIDQLTRELFLAHGGQRFRYVPCLNDRPDHARLLAALIERNLRGWV
ncbi:MAG: ferrochelatase, partial [bacterium]|nr:ferrochelatase [bacterium]